MENKSFGVLILISFALASMALLFIQYNFSGNMDLMLSGNENLMKELRGGNHLREIDRDILGVESRIRAAIATGDTSHLEGIDTKIKTVMVYLDSINTGEPDAGTERLLSRLSVLAAEKLETRDKLIERFLKRGNMNDTSFIANPRARRISNEITAITHQIYDIRQKKMVGLSKNIIAGSRKTKLYGNLLIVGMFTGGLLLCWFIFNQFRGQNKFIVKLDASEKTAREALQVKENFLANMSHEIRTPLNSILGFTNLLKRQPNSATSAEFIDAIEKAGENLMTIINDILDLSKIEAGMMRIVVAPFSVRGLTHSVETLFKEKVKEKGLLLNTIVENDVPDTLLGDATRLTQILVNLIGNALKFSDKGAIDVIFYNRSITDKTIELGVKVRDTGIGISEEKLGRIFERFNQAEDSITRNYGGTGLGLAIVKTLIQLQHGKIEVKSKPGMGTEFQFFIPYVISEEQITHEPPFDPEVMKALINPSLRILVVDDNVMNQSLMKHLLGQWDVTFTIVSNGVEALSELRNRDFDLVLMDIQMPKMDGYTATMHIREDLASDIPIIAMTAHAMAGEREKCISHGMNEYISKPIREDLLFKLIRKFLKPHWDIPTQENIMPELPHFQMIDLTYMKGISKGNTDYEKMVTGQFIAGIPNDLTELSKAFKNKDAAAVSRVAHNMKTTVAIMGLLPRLELSLNQLESVQHFTMAEAGTIQQIADVCLAARKEAQLFCRTLGAC
jgi:signal transduction histidine kinase/ActR/RegA family two-component response regulator